MPTRKRPSARQAVNEQLELARAVQSSLLPPALAPTSRFELVARFAPAQRVAGDFYDYFQPHPDLLGFYLGDVQGKGLEGAMYAALVSGIMRGLQKSGTPPSRLLGQLNYRLCLRPIPNKFCTLAYVLYDLPSRRLSYSNAGLPFPLLLRNGKSSAIQLPGFPLGLFANAPYDQQDVGLVPGDRVLFYTDGLPDSLEAAGRGREGETFLRELIESAPAASSQQMADHLLAKLPIVSADRRQQLADDTTFLLLQIF